MEDAGRPLPQSSLGRNLSDVSADFDLMDELLSEGCLLETPDCSDLLQASTSTSTSPFGSSGFLPVFEISNNSSNQILAGIDNQDDTERSVLSVNPPSDEILTGKSLDGTESFNLNNLGLPEYSIQSGELETTNPSSEPWVNWSIQPRAPLISVKDRLIHALNYIKESHSDEDVLVQIWVPIKRGNQHFLTTCGQPFSLDPNCQSLINYRMVSTSYQFSAEENSNEALGLPGRVFLGRVPEWTPDVRYFSSYEYRRVTHAQRYNVSGTIALPIFERDSRTCIGVVEVVLTTQKISYSSDLENICSALQAVDLRSSEGLTVPRVKVNNGSYQVALPEILEVLRAVCKTHNLPLAQTWISCMQQGKGGSRHSDKNYKDCVSTVDVACYVNDPSMFGFHVACSEHHLLRGQGVAGKAFTTNQTCFSSDITSFLKTEYPLSHHAKVFHLQAAVAIRLRSNDTGNADFVLEFLLPVNCRGREEQKLILNSLSITMQQVCQSLRVVTDKELEDEAALQANEQYPSDVLFEKPASGGVRRPDDGDNLLVASPSIGVSDEVPSWIARIMEAQQKGASSAFPSCVPLEFNKQEIEEFSVMTNWDQSEVVLPAGKIFSEFQQYHRDSVKDVTNQKDSSSSDPTFPNPAKTTQKRRTKTEKTVSLQVLRQYFAGSLKDAAKNIGVCPTTLKRICRQHGIARWPSRKIKKVGHSLKKLQVVIDSVQGAEGTFQFSSLYENFTKASGPDPKIPCHNKFPSLKQTDHPESSNAHQQGEGFSFHTSASNSLSSSSCSQSSSSSLGTSSESKQCTHAPQFLIKQEASLEENQGSKLKRAHSGVNLQISAQEPLTSLARSQSHNILTEHPSLGQLHKNEVNLLKVKATYGEEKVRFRLQPAWGFEDLKQETVKRFNISDLNSVDLKYLDDDSEWVLLTCDADLQECIDVYKSFCSDTVRISVHRVGSPITRASWGRTGLS